jgi:hypothetical protein
MANVVNELNRQFLSEHFAVLPGSAEIVWQVTSCRGIFEAGSPPQIHGKITTSPVDHGTKRPGRGLLTARHSQNGNLLDRVPSCGLMGNVSHYLALTLSQTLMVFPFVAGAGKSVLWYANVIPSEFHPGDLCCWPVLR